MGTAGTLWNDPPLSRRALSPAAGEAGAASIHWHHCPECHHTWACTCGCHPPNAVRRHRQLCRKCQEQITREAACEAEECFA